MKLLIGLGNPGKEYQKTRHNAGFLAIDTLASIYELPTYFSFDKKSNSEILPWNQGHEKILLVKPQTFMNESGRTVRALLDFYKLSTHDMVVFHDDKDIPLGEYRIHTNRGAAGHNGITSLIEHLGTKDFTRIRIGVGPKNTGIEKIVAYVLEQFSTEEFKQLHLVLETLARDIPKIITSP